MLVSEPAQHEKVHTALPGGRCASNMPASPCTNARGKMALDAPPNGAEGLSAAGDHGRCRVGPLDTLGAVRAEAARLYRAGRRGELPAQDAGRLATVLALVAKLIEGGELEQRMTRLEERLAEKETKR